MPPKSPKQGHGPGHGPHRHRHVLSSLSDVASTQRLEAALELVIADARDRAFVARCILQEGPAHHRASSWALITIAGEVARRAGARPREATQPDDFAVPLRLPPHHAQDEDGMFPLRVPVAPLRGVSTGDRDAEVLADAVVDGPPHHALANAALIAIFERMLDALGEPPASKP